MTGKINIEDILSHRETFMLFYKYLKHTHAEEALNFWVEAELYKCMVRRTDLQQRAKEIFNKYFKVRKCGFSACTVCSVCVHKCACEFV